MDDFWFNLFKDYYSKDLYTNDDLDLFVQGGLITEEQKTQIIASKTTSNASLENG